MATLFVDKIDPQSGTSLEIGSSGDTITVPTGATLTVPNGGLSGANNPFLFADRTGSDQTVSDGVFTKVQLDTAIFDSEGSFDNTTNYRWTPQTAGKYFITGAIRVSVQPTTLERIFVSIYKNGSFVDYGVLDLRESYGRDSSAVVSVMVELNGSTDYIELFGSLYIQGSSTCAFAQNGTYMIGYRIGD